MNNIIILITGAKGSGKTTFAKDLLRLTDRAIVFDRMCEYTDGAIVDTFDPAIDYYCSNRFGKFRLICRFRHDVEYDSFFEAIEYAHDYQHGTDNPLPPQALFLEEIHAFTSSHSIHHYIDRLYRYGRHYCINIIAVVHSDVDVHRTIRQNSDIIVAFRHRRLSKDMERYFAGDIDKITALQTYTPMIKDCVKGVHYLCSPDELDPLQEWERLNTLDLSQEKVVSLESTEPPSPLDESAEGGSVSSTGESGSTE